MKPTRKTRSKLTDEMAMRRLARWSFLGLPEERLAEIAERPVAWVQRMMATEAYAVMLREAEEERKLPMEVRLQRLYKLAEQRVNEWLGELEGPADRRHWH